MKTLVNLLGEHPCRPIVNILLGPVTVHYREVLLYLFIKYYLDKTSECYLKFAARLLSFMYY